MTKPAPISGSYMGLCFYIDDDGKIKSSLWPDESLPTSNISIEWGGTARCITSDGRNVNMAEELNRLEIKEKSKD